MRDAFVIQKFVHEKTFCILVFVILLKDDNTPSTGGKSSIKIKPSDDDEELRGKNKDVKMNVRRNEGHLSCPIIPRRRTCHGHQVQNVQDRDGVFF